MITRNTLLGHQPSNRVNKEALRFFQAIPEEMALNILNEIDVFDLGGFTNEKVIKQWIIEWAIKRLYHGGVPEEIQTVCKDLWGYRVTVKPYDNPNCRLVNGEWA